MIVPLDSVLTRRDCVSQGDVHLLEGKQMYSLFDVLMRSEGPSFKINSDCPSFWGLAGAPQVIRPNHLLWKWFAAHFVGKSCK